MMSVDAVVRRGRGRPKQYEERFHAKMTADQKYWLQEMSDAFGISCSDIMRAALDEKLDRMREQCVTIFEEAGLIEPEQTA